MQLATERLNLTPYEPADVEPLLGIFQTPAVRRYLLDEQLVDHDWVAREIASSTALFARRRVGQWTLRRAEPSARKIVGFAGYRAFVDADDLQLFYGLAPSVWGRGYATEAVRALVRHGFEVGGLDPIVGAFDRPNEASRGVLLRAGLRFWRVTDEGRFDGTTYYRLRRAEWGRPRVLFVCTHNSARSQMAEALVRARWGTVLVPDSAGTAPSRVHPLAVRVMAERGIDLAEHCSKGLGDVGPEGFDVVVTVCDDAREACPHVQARGRRVHQAFVDPSAAPGDEDARLGAFREVRDAIAAWLEATVPTWLATVP